MSEIDAYIAELTANLRVKAGHRTRILSEVRDHLTDATSHREQLGEVPEEAVVQALAAFGPARGLATQLNAEAGARAMRRAPVIAFTAGVAVFAGLIVAGKTQPNPAVPLPATLATQVAFFAAVLAFQIALVAGVCAAARARAVWHTSAARADDRAFVRQCATISADALGIAATGWAITLALALGRLSDPNRLGATVGGIIMIGSAAAAIAMTHHLRINPADDAVDVLAESGGSFGIADRFIELVHRHPVLSCGSIAALSVWPAMAHAETTFTDALPWGIAQAATVILAFFALGPALGLRRSRVA